jgi:hypothetical protein
VHAVFAFISFVWLVCCWFSAPYDHPFLNLVLFDINPIVPLVSTLLWSAAALFFWVRRNGVESWKKTTHWLKTNRKTTITLTAILVVALLIQLPAIVLYRGANDSDSAIKGLMSYHIARGESRPMYTYGLHYIGSLIPHLTAPLHMLFGENPVYQRAVHALFYLAFIVLLFAAVKRILGTTHALISCALAALAPYELLRHLRCQEFAEIIFWGGLSIYLLVRMLEEERPGPRRYFWFGAVLGIFFFVHLQALYFILAAPAALFLRDKLFFLRPRFFTVLPGFILGSIVTFIDSYYHDWIIFRGFFGDSPGVIEIFSSVYEKIGELFKHLPTLLGLKADYTNTFFLPPLVAWAIIGLAGLSLVCLIWKCRAQIKEAALMKNANPAPLVFLILAVMIVLIFTLSKFSTPNSPVRYLFPLWIVIPVTLACPFAQAKQKWAKAASGVGLLIFCGVFVVSQIQYAQTIYNLEQEWREWEDFFLENGITRFYGQYWLTYNTGFITRERVIGSSVYPVDYEPYTKYERLVADSETPPAFAFYRKHIGGYERRAASVEDALNHLGITYFKADLKLGIVYYGLSEKLIPHQMIDLKALNEAVIQGCAVQEVFESDGDVGLRLLSFRVTNSGKTTWYADGRHGFMELVIKAPSGRELRRQPLGADAKPGEEFPWRSVLKAYDVEGRSVNAYIELNGIVINFEKRPLVVDLSLGGESSPINVEELEAEYAAKSGTLKVAPDYAFLTGWGKVVRTKTVTRRWSGGAAAELGLVLRKRGDLLVNIKLVPVPAGDLYTKPQKISVSLNGEEIASAIFVPAPRAILLRLPESHQEAGLNILRFRFGQVEPYYRTTRGRNRPIFLFRPRAVALTSIEVRPM